jgi:leucyl aminopeptidase
MELAVSTGAITQQEADTVVCFVPEGQSRLAGQASQLDRALNGAITRMIRDGLVTGRSVETNVVHGGRMRAHRVVVVGAGKPAAVDYDGERRAAGNLARTLRGMNAGRVAWSTQSYVTGTVDTERLAGARAEGILLGL